MATAEQIKALIKSYKEGDSDRFIRVGMQVAAHEARKGNQHVARELRELIDEAQQQRSLTSGSRHEPTPIAQPQGELEGVVAASYPDVRLSNMVLADAQAGSLDTLLDEHRKRHKLVAQGLAPRRKLLLIGPPGTGKTMTARALAGELDLPLLSVRFDALITKFMGETSAKLRLVFEAMEENRGVYLFDEFDAIGAQRSRDNEVGEMRRVLNSFLQFIEEDDSDSIIVAATNHRELLDRALFRRFDDVIPYELPGTAHRVEMMKQSLANFEICVPDWERLSDEAEGLSYADLQRACEDAAKKVILEERRAINTTILRETIHQRKQSGYHSFRE